MITISKRFTFDSAHNLPNYKGKCKNMHGHTYILEVYVTAYKLIDGFIIDFVELKKIVKKVIDRYDHQYLNEFFDNPTAEIMVEFIGLEIQAKIHKQTKGRCKVLLIKLWETQDSCAIWEPEYKYED